MIYWAVFLFISLGGISWWYYCVDGTFWRFLYANCRAIHVVHRLCWYEKLRSTRVREHTVLQKTALTFDTNSKFGVMGGLSKLPLKVKVKSLSRVQVFVTTWTVAYQAPPSIGFSRQEYWSGLPFPSPEYLPDPGIEPRSPDSFICYKDPQNSFKAVILRVFMIYYRD